MLIKIHVIESASSPDVMNAIVKKKKLNISYYVKYKSSCYADSIYSYVCTFYVKTTNR